MDPIVGGRLEKPTFNARQARSKRRRCVPSSGSPTVASLLRSPEHHGAPQPLIVRSQYNAACGVQTHLDPQEKGHFRVTLAYLSAQETCSRIALEAVCEKEVIGVSAQAEHGTGLFDNPLSQRLGLQQLCVRFGLFESAWKSTTLKGFEALLSIARVAACRSGTAQRDLPFRIYSPVRSPSSCASFVRSRALSASPVPPSTLRSFCSTARTASRERSTRAKDSG